MRVSDYVTNREYEILFGPHKGMILPVGSFVKPISGYYLPAHIKDSVAYRFFDSEKDLFCYCRYGIILFPKDLVRRI